MFIFLPVQHKDKYSYLLKKSFKVKPDRVDVLVEALSFSMKLVLLSACLALAAAATPERDSYTQILFAKFQQEHNKEYKTRAEHNHRFNVFAENVRKINEHNSAGHSYQKGKETKQLLLKGTVNEFYKNLTIAAFFLKQRLIYKILKKF